MLNDTDADLQEGGGFDGEPINRPNRRSGRPLRSIPKVNSNTTQQRWRLCNNCRRGQVLNDRFSYTVSDGTNTASSEVFVSIVGKGHDVVASMILRSQTTDQHVCWGESGVLLANDTDADVEDVLTITASDALSQQGAIVTVFPDGSFLYESYAAYADGSLREGDVGLDTFTIRFLMGMEARRRLPLR